MKQSPHRARAEGTSGLLSAYKGLKLLGGGGNRKWDKGLLSAYKGLKLTNQSQPELLPHRVY